jgi:hypothetical protein
LRRKSNRRFSASLADRTALIDLETIRTTPLNLALDRWGIAVMNVQANVPNTLPGQAVTFLLLGDAQVENRVVPEEAHIPPDPVSCACAWRRECQSAQRTEHGQQYR